MRAKPNPRRFFQRSFIALVALLSCSLLSTPADKMQSVFVFAARDSRLLTMDPHAGEVALPGGKTWKSDNNAMVSLLKRDEMIHFADDSHANVRLPRPASDRHETGVSELDRIAPDPVVRTRVEKAFAKRKEYVVTDSLDNADLVFLAEGTYVCLSGWDTGRGATISLGADRETNFLQAALAIVVPARVFGAHAGDGRELMAARLWEGSVVYQFAQSTLKSASVEDLVGQFLSKAQRPRSHFPLCAATGHPLLMAESVQGTTQGEPVLKHPRLNQLPGRTRRLPQERAPSR